MEKLLYDKNKQQVDGGTGLVHHLHFYEVVQQETPETYAYVKGRFCQKYVV